MKNCKYLIFSSWIYNNTIVEVVNLMKYHPVSSSLKFHMESGISIEITGSVFVITCSMPLILNSFQYKTFILFYKDGLSL